MKSKYIFNFDMHCIQVTALTIHLNSESYFFTLLFLLESIFHYLSREWLCVSCYVAIVFCNAYSQKLSIPIHSRYLNSTHNRTKENIYIPLIFMLFYNLYGIVFQNINRISRHWIGIFSEYITQHQISNVGLYKLPIPILFDWLCFWLQLVDEKKMTLIWFIKYISKLSPYSICS